VTQLTALKLQPPGAPALARAKGKSRGVTCVSPLRATVSAACSLLVFVQVFLGLLLRGPCLRRTTVLRRRHGCGMAGIVALALGHIVLSSALVHRLVPW
jgi:hypothetical protein